MTVQELWYNNTFYTIEKDHLIPENFHALVEYGLLASKKDPFDPMEKALDVLGHKIDGEHIHNFPLIEEYPLTKELLALSHAWQKPESEEILVASK